MWEKLKQRARKTGTDYGLLVPLLVNSLMMQTVVSIVRITTSYRAVELELSVIWLGVITAAFALLPIFVAVWVGRFVDRGHDAPAAWIGSALIIAGCVGFVLWPSAPGLFLATTVHGVGHLFLVIAQQMLCIRCAGPGRMEHVFGNYMVVNALGHGLGPYVVGWAGGAATIPPTHLLFMIALAASVVVLVSALAMRPGADHLRKNDGGAVVPVRDLLGIRGFRAVLVLSVFTVTSQDLIVVYLPVMGAERGIDVRDVGLLLTARALSAMVSRLIYARMIERIGRRPLIIWTTAAGALSFLCLMAPLPLAAIYAALIVMGFSLGIAMTLSISTVIDLSLPGARGTANSLRLLGNRFGQFVIPIGAGAVAAASGVSAIFLMLALALAGSAAMLHLTWPRR
jgi:MFS family permease